MTVDTLHFTVNLPIVRSPTSQQHVFNALTLFQDSAYVGCEDGSVLHTLLSKASHGDDIPLYTGTSPVLDLECSAAALYVAAADGTVLGIDRHSGSPLWRVHLGSGSIDRSIPQSRGEEHVFFVSPAFVLF